MALSPGMQPSPGQAACQGATKGAFTGLVLGILMGCWEEKRFVMRNCLKEYHLRECPTRLFAVMIRAVTTAPVLATFIGVHSGLRCWWHLQQQERQQGEVQQRQEQEHREAVLQTCPQQFSTFSLHQPALAGVAGTAAGAVRTLLSEAALAMHPVVHAQRSVAAGLAAAGVFGLGGWLEQEEDRQKQQRQQWEQQIGMSDCD